MKQHRFARIALGLAALSLAVASANAATSNVLTNTGGGLAGSLGSTGGIIGGAPTYANTVAAAAVAAANNPPPSAVCLGAPAPAGCPGSTIATATPSTTAGPDINAIRFAGIGLAEMAAASQTPLVFGPQGVGVAIGVGEYAGYSALGVNVAQRFRISGSPAAVSIGGSFAAGAPQLVLHAGIDFGF